MRYSIWNLLIIVAMIGGCLAWVNGPSRARKALPWNATEINEYYLDAGFLPDFVRLLRAKIDEEDFEAYATRLGLNKRFAEEPTEAIFWPTCPEPWWDPPDNLINARYSYTAGEEYFVVAAYDNGYVYFAANAW